MDAAAALADLAKLERARAQSSEDQFRKANSALQQAAGSPSTAGRLYETAIEGTGTLDFADWKKRNSDLLRDKAFQEAVQIHLRYLLLSLEWGRSEDSVGWAEPSLQYARELASWTARQDNRHLPNPARDMLNKPLAESPFVRWLHLGPFLPSGEVWEQSPGNLSAILEKNVRIPWRAVGDERLDTTWQLEMEAAAVRATDIGEHAAEHFNTHAAPSLLVRRAMDRVATGEPNRAAADILAVARKHPDHPEFPRWATTLREMLEAKAHAAPSP